MTRSSSPRAPAARKSTPGTLRSAPRQVRIIGGDWKRTPLAVVDVEGLRPTPDRVRETLFNWLGQRLEGAACLDLFAGTGALGFEAASRGARRVLMIERNAKAAAQLRAIKARLNAASVEVAEADGMRLGAGLPQHSFDVVFLDPPFDSTLLPKALSIAGRLAARDGTIYVEAPVALPLESDEDDEGGEDEDGIDAAGDEAPEAGVAARRTAQSTANDGSPLSAAFAELHADGWRINRSGRAGAVFYHLLRRETDE